LSVGFVWLALRVFAATALDVEERFLRGMVDVLALVVVLIEEDEGTVFATAELRVTRLRLVGGCLEVKGWDSSSEDEADWGAARFLPFRSATGSLMVGPVEADAFERLEL